MYARGYGYTLFKLCTSKHHDGYVVGLLLTTGVLYYDITRESFNPVVFQQHKTCTTSGYAQISIIIMIGIHMCALSAAAFIFTKFHINKCVSFRFGFYFPRRAARRTPPKTHANIA